MCAIPTPYTKYYPLVPQLGVPTNRITAANILSQNRKEITILIHNFDLVFRLAERLIFVHDIGFLASIKAFVSNCVMAKATSVVAKYINISDLSFYYILYYQTLITFGASNYNLIYVLIIQLFHVKHCISTNFLSMTDLWLFCS